MLRLAAGDHLVGESLSQAQPIQRAQTLHLRKRRGDALRDSAPLLQGVALAKDDAHSGQLDVVLATLAENAVKHGVEPKIGPARIDIRAQRTDDGRLQARIADPQFKLPKTYLVQVEGMIERESLDRLREGFGTLSQHRQVLGALSFLVAAVVLFVLYGPLNLFPASTEISVAAPPPTEAAVAVVPVASVAAPVEVVASAPVVVASVPAQSTAPAAAPAPAAG